MHRVSCKLIIDSTIFCIF